MDGWMSEGEGEGEGVMLRTLFADERVVPVVGIVRVTKSSMRILEFEKLVAVLARVTRANFCAMLRVSQSAVSRQQKEDMVCVLVSVLVISGYQNRHTGKRLRGKRR